MELSNKTSKLNKSVTTELIELSVSTPESLRDLQIVKETFCLTDFGLRFVISHAYQVGLNTFNFCCSLQIAIADKNDFGQLKI